MRLRSGKICHKFEFEHCSCGKVLDLADYSPPRLCNVISIFESSAKLINNQTLSQPRDDKLWQHADGLLDQISELLTNGVHGGIHGSGLSISEHCRQLEQCNRILKKLQGSTEGNVKKVLKQVNVIDNCYAKLLPLCLYLRDTKDHRYKKLLKSEMNNGSSPYYLLYCLKKLKKLFNNRLKIAEKHCILTKRTADLVKFAVDSLRQRFQQMANSSYDSAPVQGTKEETRRRQLISENVRLATAEERLGADTCLICLEDFKTNVTLAKPELKQKELEMDDTDDDAEIVDEKSAFRTTKCPHIFHKECLETWLLIKMRCPTCRIPIDPELVKTSSQAATTQTEA